jgi:hypothetical protein
VSVITSAQVAVANSGESAVTPEIEAALRLMFAPGREIHIHAAGRSISVEHGSDARRGRRFAVLPNVRSPRWLVPLDSQACTWRSLAQVRVFAPGAKAAKLALQAVAALGALPVVANTLSASGDMRGSLFDKLADVIGRSTATFFVTFGTPSGYRKLTVSVMGRDGIPVGFLKVPMTQEARARIEHEGEMLQALSHTAVANVVPRVLFRGEWDGQATLFISAGPDQASAMQFGNRHLEFLRKLWRVRPTVRSGEALMAVASAQVEPLAATMSQDEANVLSSALERARRELSGKEISCGLSHGDFAPWNLRNATDGMFAFDWEATTWDEPNIWDIAHYDTQLVTLLGYKSRYREITREMLSAQGLYLLYLAKTIADASRESGASSTQVSDRVRLLRNALQY